MTRQSPPKSALSEPENFISETRLRRIVRRYGWLMWTVAAGGLLGIGAVAFFVSGQRPPVEQPRAVALPKTDAPRAQAPASAPPAPMPPPPPPPAAADRAKGDPWLPAKAPEPRRVVEQGGSVPEQIADLPPPAIDAPTEAQAPSPGPAPADAAGPEQPSKPSDSTASLPADPEAIGPGEREKLPNTASMDPSEKIKEADRYLSRGQISIARYIYEDAFKAGDVLGAIGMARSYDPAYLKSIRSRAVGHTEKAALWYRRAAEMSARATKSTP